MPCPGLPWTPPGMEAPPQIQVIPFPRCLKLVWPSFPSGEGHCERESALQASGIFQTHPYFQKLGYMTTALIPTPWLLLGIIFLREWPPPLDLVGAESRRDKRRRKQWVKNVSVLLPAHGSRCHSCFSWQESKAGVAEFIIPESPGLRGGHCGLMNAILTRAVRSWEQPPRMRNFQIILWRHPGTEL